MRYAFLLLLALFGACATPAPEPSETAFRLAERDLIPEGIVHDASDGSFYVSSIYRRKIVRIDAAGRVKDFIPEARDSVAQVLGVDIDPERRILWACSYTGSRPGYDALYAFDLKSGRTIGKYFPADSTGPHLLNDLEVANDGTVYVTDTEKGAVYALSPGQKRLAEFLKPGTFRYPNGITFSAGRSGLFVADELGLSRVDLASRTVKRLNTPEGEDLVGIDGLYFSRGRLIGVQNWSQKVPERILSIELEQDSIVNIRVLEERPEVLEVPTTGVPVGRMFYFIASSQLKKLDQANGLIPHPDSLQQSEIRVVEF